MSYGTTRQAENSIGNPDEENLQKVDLNATAISLRCLFQIVTACCVFFACLRVSPTFTLIGTVILAPAIIRTAWASHLFRLNGRVFCWSTRIQYFIGSLGIVLTTIALGGIVFALICLAFGVMGLLFGMMVSANASFESALVGAVGGMIWGIAGALLAMVFTAMRIGPLEIDSTRPQKI